MSPQSNSEVVLVVEDELVSKFVRSLLTRHGYRVMQAELPQAVELLQTREVNVDLLITNRPEPFLPFAEQVPLVYMAAFPDPALASRFRACRALVKPFPNARLVAATKELAGSLRR